MILDDLDAACKAALETVHRSIGQRARHAKAQTRLHVDGCRVCINATLDGAAVFRPRAGGFVYRYAGEIAPTRIDID